MNAFLSVTLLSAREYLRSGLCAVVAMLLAVGLAALPLIVIGDGTAVGFVQIALLYAVGFTSILLCTASILGGCLGVADDIGSRRIHLVRTKPIAVANFLAGKWLGVCFVNALLLCASGIAIYGALMMKVRSTEFSAEERAQLRREIFTGRSTHEAARDTFDALVRQEYESRIRRGNLSESVPYGEVRSSIERAVRLRMTTVPAQRDKEWHFTGLPATDADQPSTLRYRLFVDSPATRGLQETEGTWIIQNPGTGNYYTVTGSSTSGSFHELAIPTDAIGSDGSLLARYRNQDLQHKEVIFQLADGPRVLVQQAGFAANFMRLMMLILVKILFLGLLGSVAGALFATPPAIFFSLSYVFIAAMVLFMRATFPDMDAFPASSLPAQIAYWIRTAAAHIVVNINEFPQIRRLGRGELLEAGTIMAAAGQLLILRGLPIGLLGAWCLSTRELGKVLQR